MCPSNICAPCTHRHSHMSMYVHSYPTYEKGKLKEKQAGSPWGCVRHPACELGNNYNKNWDRRKILVGCFWSIPPVHSESLRSAMWLFPLKLSHKIFHKRQEPKSLFSTSAPRLKNRAMKADVKQSEERRKWQPVQEEWGSGCKTHTPGNCLSKCKWEIPWSLWPCGFRSLTRWGRGVVLRDRCYPQSQLLLYLDFTLSFTSRSCSPRLLSPSPQHPKLPPPPSLRPKDSPSPSQLWLVSSQVCLRIHWAALCLQTCCKRCIPVAELLCVYDEL